MWTVEKTVDNSAGEIVSCFIPKKRGSTGKVE